ncbi:Calmodulin [Thalictrum thalictroides]|uniref:Calmodulin n=1 Tax=Thalictrum thalictroides TaxID=46969 RepID=A0A7J6VEU5_THATH|nr:Calmodulin [Thalictrum thalictroides]
MSSNSSSGSSSSVSKLSKPSKWLFNKTFKLTLPRSISNASSSTTIATPPMSPLPSAKPNKFIMKGDGLEQVFAHFDSDGDGKISSLELRAYFGSIGDYISHDEAQGVINDLDVNGDGLLDFNEFTQFMMNREGADEDLKSAFEMFEAEKGSGCITPKSLQRMLNRLGDSKSFEDCEAMIQVYDLDDNGILDFHEFHRMMT